MSLRVDAIPARVIVPRDMPTTSRSLRSYCSATSKVGEHIEFGGERYTVAAGDTFVWDSSKATQFEVYESLHKVALAMPSRLLSHNALSALNQMPRKFDPSSGSRFLLNNLIGAVADEI